MWKNSIVFARADGVQTGLASIQELNLDISQRYFILNKLKGNQRQHVEDKNEVKSNGKSV